MFTKLYHVAINVRNLDRSIAFYEALGYQVATRDQITGGRSPQQGEQLGVASSHAYRYAIMALTADLHGPMLDLVEWLEPLGDGDAPRSLTRIGLARVCFQVADIEAAYERMQSMGIRFFNDVGLREYDVPSGKVRMMLPLDPDGVVLEVLDWQGGPHHH